MAEICLAKLCLQAGPRGIGASQVASVARDTPTFNDCRDFVYRYQSIEGILSFHKHM